MELITSDSHAGLEAARKAVFPSVAWQRCQFHLQQNASQYVVRVEQRKEVAADIRAIFNAPSRSEADRLLAAVVKKYAAERATTERVDGGESGARANSNELSLQSIKATADDESVRASESRDKEADSSGEHIPECAIT